MVSNIADKFEKSAARQGGRIGLVESRTGRKFSFDQLSGLAGGYAAYLSEQSVRPGDRVVLMVTPSADFICLTFGLFKLGATIILIDPGMGFKNLLRCIDGVKPDIFIGVPKAYAFCLLFKKHFSAVRRKFCCGNSFGLFGKDLRKRAKRCANIQSAVYQPTEEDLAAIIFTTGSTGPPKGVRYEHAIFSAQLERIRDYYGINDQHTDQPAFPLFALFSAALGARSVIPDMDPTRPARVDPEKFIQSIRENSVTYSFGSPAIWNVVSEYCQKNTIVLESLQKVLMAGAPVPGELLERVKSILPESAEIYTPYGATESLPIVSIEGREVLEQTLPYSRQGKGTCVGRPLPGIDLKIIEMSDDPILNYTADLELEVGEIGEIIVRGDVVTKGYENNRKETSLAKIIDGETFWHRMGDVGYRDENGRLWFCGRKAHRVQTADEILFTIPCEAIINEHKEVYRSALVGVPIDNQSYCEPVILIEPRKDFKGEEKKLLQEVEALAKASKVTERINTFLVHDDFPVDIRHNAKIFREKLAVWAGKKLQSNS